MHWERRTVNEPQAESGISELESALGHGFACPGLLRCALTHRSLVHELAQTDGGTQVAPTEDNERLEFLGDAVLGLVVAEALYAAHPEWHEGALTRVRSGLVSRERMARVAEAIGLGRHLRLSRGEERSGLRHKSTVLSNSMEAVMGALYLDGGLDAVRAFANRRVLGETVDQLALQLRSGAAMGNYKSALQERLQASRAGSPVYRLKSESGPDHHKRFMVEVRIKSNDPVHGQPLARGTGRTKKLAEQDAARRALEALVRTEAGNGGQVESAPGAEPDAMTGETQTP